MKTTQGLRALAHRYLWQSLPRDARRRLLVGLSSALAPRPSRGVAAQSPIIVVGYLTAASGLGASARLCHDALSAAGLPVMGIDLSRRFRQDDRRVSFSFIDASNHLGPATLCLHINSPFVPLALLSLGRRRLEGKFVVGYWAWELPVAPSEWQAGLRFVHHILVPSSFTAQAVSALEAPQPIDVLPHPVAVRSAPNTRHRHPQAPFTVLVAFDMASSFERKNPMGSINAFRTAFGDDPSVRLIVKVQNPQRFPPGAECLRVAAASQPNIVLEERNFSPDEVSALYADCDVVMSLHRSEGFGLVIAEAMLAGRPVIATNWSGNTDFFSPDVGFPISSHLVPAIDPQGEYDDPRTQWADPDIGEAAAALRSLRADPELRSRLGAAAALQAARAFSATAYVDQFRRLLQMP